MTSVDHLIIGGGIAGTTAAETIRKHDANATIVIVSEELHPLYSRVLLPHYLLGKIKREFVFLKKDAWYETNAITLLKGHRLIHLDPQNHEATIDDGATYRYRKLLLSSGGRARTLELPAIGGITYFRTLDDADRIHETLNTIIARPAAERVGCIYGGGFIALEYAPIFRHHQLETHLVLRNHHLWDTLLDPRASAILDSLLAEQDIHLHRSSDYVKVNGSGELSAVETSRASIPARILGIGIGLLPNFEVMAAAGIHTSIGIRTNGYLETNAPDVYAAGDVAEFFDTIAGRERLIGNWMNAREQGAVVAHNMLGEHHTFELVSSYSTSPFGFSITFIGDVTPRAGTKIIERSNPKERSHGQMLIDGNRILGAILLNMNRERLPITTLIKQKKDIHGLETQLADPEFDLNYALP